MKYLEEEYHKKLYFTEKGCALINRAQEMIVRERIVIRDERNIFIPGCQIFLVNDSTIKAFTTNIDGEYCIFINKGIIEEQKNYLEGLSWSLLSDEKQRSEYIDSIIEYGFYFIAFHEYAHIFCGHNAAGLTDLVDIRAEECEADMLAMNYLTKYIEFNNKIDDYMVEMEKLFLAVYFLFEKMQKEDGREYYNNKLIKNYYDSESIAKRDHPLNAQRILYLYEMLNIVIVTDKIQVLPIKENIIEKLRLIKGLTGAEIPSGEKYYLLVNESVQALKRSIRTIREKIPRIGEGFES